MKITTYIQQALFEHHCVIVPGFGGFLKEDKSATINPITNQFVAPGTSLAFNSSLTKDDGLLKSEISIKENISLDQAFAKIKQFVDATQATINKENQIEFEGLGVFSKNGSSLMFTPGLKNNYNIEGFGLDSFISPSITPYFVMTEENKNPGTTSIRTPTEGVGSKETKRKSSLRWLYVALPSVLVLAVGTFVGYKYSKNEWDVSDVFASKKNKVKNEQASLVNSFGTDSNSKNSVSTESENTDTVATDSWGAETPATSEVASTDDFGTDVKSQNKTSKSVVNGLKYHIIGAVFGTQKNAQEFIEAHTEANILEIEGKYKISIASFANIEDAKSGITNLQTEFGSDIWIFKQK